MTIYSNAFRYTLMPFLALLFFLPFSAYSQQVMGSVDRDSISVGDELRYTVIIPNITGVDDYIYPDSSDFGHDFDLIERSAFSGVHSDSAVYHLRYFGVDEAEVPELPVGLISGRDTVWVYVPPIPMQFISRVSDEGEPFRPFKPLYEFTISLLPYILIALLLALLGWMAWRRYSNRQIVEKPAPPEPVEIPPFKDPLLTLEQDLEAIKADFPNPEEDYKAYYSHLGDAIRMYFEELYAIPAMESTTAELARAQRSKLVHDSLQTYTLLILQQADMVKFARFKPDNGQCLNVMKAANNFLIEARNVDAARIRSLKLKHEAFVRKVTSEEDALSAKD